MCHNLFSFVDLSSFILCIALSWHYWQIMASLPELNSCSIGTPLHEKCKRNIEVLKDISDFDDEKRKLLMLCYGLGNISTICDYHEWVYYGKFVCKHGKYCCTSTIKEWKVVLYSFNSSYDLVQIKMAKSTFLAVIFYLNI